MRCILYTLAFLALSSCAHTAADYYREGVTEEDLAKDSAACEMAAESHANGAGAFVRSGIYNKMFDPCMRSKGYKRK